MSLPAKILIMAKTIAGLTKKNQKSSALVKQTPNRKNIIVDISSSDEDDRFSLHDKSKYKANTTQILCQLFFEEDQFFF